MSKLLTTSIVVAGLLVICGLANCAPWWDLLLGSQYQPSASDPYYDYYRSRNGYNGYAAEYGGYRNPRSGSAAAAPAASGKERYKSLCRVLNPDNYAFPDQVPFPSAPLCPY